MNRQFNVEFLQDVLTYVTKFILVRSKGTEFTSKGPAPYIGDILSDPELLWTEDSALDEERIQEAQLRIEKQGAAISQFWKDKYVNKAGTFWHQFYQRNSTHFYKDRHYLHIVFPELAPESTRNSPLRLLEVGCGVGNAVLPLLELNQYLLVHAIDFATSAIDILKTNEYCSKLVLDIDNRKSAKKIPRLNASVCDIVKDELPQEVVAGSMDFVLCMFVLSAISPLHQQDVISKLLSCLKPGGKLLMRDYGRYDEAQLRFGKGSKLADNFYVRQDGTCAYYYDVDELKRMVESAGGECEECYYILRQYANRGQKMARRRVWVHAKFIKTN